MKLNKAYQPSKHEDTIYKLWEKHEAFAPKNRGNKDSFSIVVPPPNANGDLHIGHGLTLAIEDIAVRYHRMKGEASLLLPGADHAGFETWVVYEKQLAAKGKSRFDYSREELYDQIWDFVAQNKENYLSQFRQLGASVDWSRYTYTLDEKIVKQAYASFQKMWHDGLVYRAEKLVNFCTYHGTGFADIEVAHKETAGHLWFIRYELTDGSDSVVVATTRPETMLGDTAVAVHPEDPRYQKFIGKTVKLPLTNREIPIIADTYVDREYGTGAVKITPAHDQNDNDMAKRHDLPMISVIGHDGLITHPAAEEFIGLEVLVGREKIIQNLTEQGLIVKIEDITHSVGHCYKCGTVIEPLLREQWFIDMKPLAEQAVKVLNAKKITFYPEKKREQLITYLENLRDWNISRQIAWGIPIPAFQNANDPSDWIFDDRVDQESITVDGQIYHRDPDVFDTWFSSSSWPYATLNFPDGEDFEKFYPLSLMETGGEILYPWVSRMIMLGLYNTGKIPFKEVYIHGYVMAEDGAKMSKSIGNVVDPIPVIEKFGSDALRLGLISGRTPAVNRGYDQRRVEEARNFCNKLWNISRFVQEQVGDKSPTTPKHKTAADHWMLSNLQHTTKLITSDLDKYRLSEAYDKLYHFVWDDFADWYIEASKTSPNNSVLQFGLISILKLAHPFAPFVTETIWQALGWSDELLITSGWPTIPAIHVSDTKHTKDFEIVRNTIIESRRLVKAMNLKKPGLLHKSDVLAENEKTITAMAGLGSLTKVEKGRGLQLSNVGVKAWIDINQATIAQYKDDLVRQQNEQSEVIAHLQQRLNNKNYVANAPDRIVQETREQVELATKQLEHLKAEIDKIN